MKIVKIGETVTVKVPARIHMSLFNENEISTEKQYGGGALSIALQGFFLNLTIKKTLGELKISGGSKKLIKYIIKIFFMHAPQCGENYNFNIKIQQKNIKHIGFGSSVQLFLGILVGLNILYDYPLTNKEIRIITGKYYREIEFGKLIHGYETGGGPACMLYGGICILTNQLTIIDCIKIPSKYKLLCFIPNIYYQGNKNIGRDIFSETEVFKRSQRFSYGINATASKVLYDLIPCMKQKNICILGDLIEDLNFMVGNIGTITTRYTSAYFYLFERIRMLGGIITGLSSTGPTVYVLGESKILKYIIKCLKDDIAYNFGIFSISNGISCQKNSKTVRIKKFPNLDIF